MLYQVLHDYLPNSECWVTNVVYNTQGVSELHYGAHCYAYSMMYSAIREVLQFGKTMNAALLAYSTTHRTLPETSETQYTIKTSRRGTVGEYLWVNWIARCPDSDRLRRLMYTVTDTRARWFGVEEAHEIAEFIELNFDTPCLLLSREQFESATAKEDDFCVRCLNRHDQQKNCWER